MHQALLQTTPQVAALSDEEIVERVVAGETELFEILMRRYNQRLYRVARGFVRDPAEAEDIIQEAYVSAFRKLDGFRGEARFATWLTRIAVYEAMARGRKGRRFVVLDDETAAGVVSAESDPERETVNQELRDLLRETVDSLPASLRSVFVLREIEGLSSEQTATLLGIEAGNVRVRLHRAKSLLQGRLGDRIGRAVRQLYAFDGARCDRVVAAVFARLGES